MRRIMGAFLLGLACIGLAASAALGGQPDKRELSGTVWVANRGTHTIRGFDAATGAVVRTVEMTAGSQPGDLAYAKGKLYVAEEFRVPAAVAVVDADTGEILSRIELQGTTPRPHHVHVSPGGNLVAFGMFGTNKVGVIDTHTDTLVGTWQASESSAARSHAGVFSSDGQTIYVANDVTEELTALDAFSGELLWTMKVPKVHELVVTHDGKSAYVSCRADGKIRLVDLDARVVVGTIDLGTSTPDTLQLTANEKLLTVGLRGTPAQVALVDTATLTYSVVTIGGVGTIAGHQWTSPNGHFTFAAFEGTGAGVAVIDHDEDAVVQTLDYPGRPHGVDFARP